MVVDCLSLWVANVLERGDSDAQIELQSREAIVVATERAGQTIVVSNEVGCGIMPANKLSRRFADVLGDANRRLASAADEVFACWAGIAHKLK